MGGHKREAYDDGIFRNCGRNDRSDEHTLVQGQFHGRQALLHVPYEERDDGGLGMPNVESSCPEALVGTAGKVPEMIQALGLRLHDVEGRADGCHICRRHAGAEYQGTGIMFEIIDYGVVARDESSQGTEGFGEGSHYEVGLVGKPEMVRSSAALLAENPKSVGIVHHNGGIVLFAEFHYSRQVGQVSLHRVNPVHDYQLGGFHGHGAELLLQRPHIVVLEFEDLAETQAAAVDDAGVVEGIQKDESVPESQARNHSQIDLETGAVCNCFVLAHEGGKFLFKFEMYVEGAVQEPGTGAGGAVFAYSCNGGFLEPGVVGKPQIGIGTEHHHVLPGHLDHRILSGRYRPIIGVNAQGFYLVRQRETGADIIKVKVHTQTI